MIALTARLTLRWEVTLLAICQKRWQHFAPLKSWLIKVLCPQFLWFPLAKAQKSQLGQSKQPVKRILWNLIQCYKLCTAPHLTFCTGWLFSCAVPINQSLHSIRIHYVNAVMSLISIELQLHGEKTVPWSIAAQKVSIKLVCCQCETYKLTFWRHFWAVPLSS